MDFFVILVYNVTVANYYVLGTFLRFTFIIIFIQYEHKFHKLKE